MSHEVQLAEMTNALRDRVRLWTAQGKALKALDGALAAGDAAAASRAYSELNGEALEGLGLGDWVGPTLQELKARVKELRRAQRQAFAQELAAAAEGTERSFRRLGEQPPEFLLAPFAVQLDTKTLEAVLLFAREELDRCAADADTVLERAAAAEKSLAVRQLPPEEHFELLLLAYRAAVGARGLAMGERVDLVEVLPQTALLYQARGFHEDPGRGRFFAYSKARFLYDLHRLRQARVLSRGNLRLDLGTATGDSVKKKGRVFFVPSSDGGGQYYLSLRFAGGR